jgi:ketosteroid isomerase-like protein
MEAVMRLASISLAICAVTLVGCQQSTRLTPSQKNIQTNEVTDRFNEFIKHVNNNEIDDAMAMYDQSEGLTLVFTDGRRAFGADAAGSLRDFMGTLNFINMVPQNPNVDVLDAKTAVVTFRFSVDAILNDTSRDPFAGQATLVWIKDPTDDLWKIHTQHLSRNPS